MATPNATSPSARPASESELSAPQSVVVSSSLVFLATSQPTTARLIEVEALGPNVAPELLALRVRILSRLIL